MQAFEVTHWLWELKPLLICENHHARSCGTSASPWTEIYCDSSSRCVSPGQEEQAHLSQWNDCRLWLSPGRKKDQKLSKYGNLCTDLRKQCPGYCLDMPLVIRGLGTVTTVTTGGDRWLGKQTAPSMTVCRKATHTELLHILFTLTQFGLATMERFVVGYGYIT